MNPPNPPSIFLPWGGLTLPDAAMEAHSFIVGSPKSGKTVLLRMLMRAALLDFAGRLRVRALVYDGKRELYPILLGMGVPKDQIHLLLPTDARSAPWDIAADIHTVDHAHVLAETLVPVEPQARESYFPSACRAVLSAVCWVLCCERPGAWCFHDLIEILADKSRIQQTLCRTARGRFTYKAYFDVEKTGGDVLSTIHTSVVTKYESIALLWKNSAEPPVSLTKWASNPAAGVLVMTPDATSAGVANINTAMFRWIAQQLDARPDLTPQQAHAGHESWLFLDEFRFAGDLHFLDGLLGKGRSKGIRVNMAAQSIEGLVAVYGEPRTFEMMNNASNLAVLRMATRPAAEKIAKMFGQYEVIEEDLSESEAKTYKSGLGWVPQTKTRTMSRSTKKVMKDNVLASTLISFPSASQATGIHGYFSTPSVGTWEGPIPWNYVEQWLSDKNGETPDFVPRPTEHFNPTVKIELPRSPSPADELSEPTESDHRSVAAQPKEPPPKEQPRPLRSEDPNA